MDDLDPLLADVFKSCKELCEGKEVKNVITYQLSKYRKARSDENNMYTPLAKLVNKLLETLEDETLVKFLTLKKPSSFRPRMVVLATKQIDHLYDTMDPKNSSTRRPDLIFISKDLFDKIKGSKLESYKFEWSDVLMTWELKLALNKTSPTPPTDFGNCMHTEYIHLPDGQVTGSKLGTDHYIAKNKKSTANKPTPTTSSNLVNSKSTPDPNNPDTSKPNTRKPSISKPTTINIGARRSDRLSSRSINLSTTSPTNTTIPANSPNPTGSNPPTGHVDDNFLNQPNGSGLKLFSTDSKTGSKRPREEDDEDGATAAKKQHEHH
ncbi:hypothetical protein BDQ17DRAFT_621918 [Cyathus striatus]|nr:hypothetical protein BDQ17DRAFT_621918 [Cyathus striatus]